MTTPEGSKVSVPITIAMGAEIVDASPGNHVFYWGASYNTADSSPFHSWRFMSNSGGTLLGLRTNDGTSEVTPGAWWTLATGIHHFCGTLEANYQALFVDGRFLDDDTASLGSGPAYASDSLITFGMGNLASRTPGANLLYGYAWARALAPAEIRSLSENPWQLFTAPPVYFGRAAAPATPPNLYPIRLRVS